MALHCHQNEVHKLTLGGEFVGDKEQCTRARTARTNGPSPTSHHSIANEFYATSKVSQSRRSREDGEIRLSLIKNTKAIVLIPCLTQLVYQIGVVNSFDPSSSASHFIIISLIRQHYRCACLTNVHILFNLPRAFHVTMTPFHQPKIHLSKTRPKPAGLQPSAPPDLDIYR